jgi:nondiscriminating aspartyl-tRNA synthetase
MGAVPSARTFAIAAGQGAGDRVLLRGWIHRLRILSHTTFLILRDCTAEVQCVFATGRFPQLTLRLDDAVEVSGSVRPDARAKRGFEIDVEAVCVLNSVAEPLPFNSSGKVSGVGFETQLDYRSLAVRNERVGNIFRLQGAILRYFREFMREQHATEILTSKLVSSGTEGGTNLFHVRYFDQVAYLAQSPQFYKEHGVGALERVFETGHVYRAEPHASSRHLTEYYSLDLEIGFIDGPEEIIELERSLLDFIFGKINECHADLLRLHGAAVLPSMQDVPVWEFAECLRRLREAFGTQHLTDDLDPQAERQLCALAERETGVAAVFVLGFPLSSRPFYTAPRGERGAAQSFDLLFRGLEITTGGQRLHRRSDLEDALRRRGIDPTGFESHLRMFELGMPPHGGLAIGLERLTAQILGLSNVREAVLYPRDRYRLMP